jgi:o-succinylbenzoate synthase
MQLMQFKVEFRVYRRRFAKSLVTSWGTWETREGIILRLADDRGNVGWGEIAPIPWFGSETLEEALEFCHQLSGKITTETIVSIPDNLPACQFGFASAGEDLGLEIGAQDTHPTRENLSYLPPTKPQSKIPNRKSKINCLPPTNSQSKIQSLVEQTSCHPPTKPQSKIPNRKSKIQLSGLLPTGEAALQAWQPLWEQGYRTFKWKIGVAAIEAELQIFEQLIEVLPASASLRLDANGGLSYQEAEKWLRLCNLRSQIEFLEQPLPPNQFDAMLKLSQSYCTAIALDESVATLAQMQACYESGWRGIFVIKPAIAGSPSRLRYFCQQYNIDAVFSSVFETEIGRKTALKLAVELSRHNRAVGFGVNHWFADDNTTWLDNLWKNY